MPPEGRAAVLFRAVRRFIPLGHAAPSRRKREGGFALLLTIWILILVALMAASLAAQIHSETTIAHNGAELAAAKGLADAGVAFGVNGLLDPIVTNRWPADGRTRLVRYGDGTIEIHVQDEAGKLDLNMAPIELISGLLHVLAIDGADSASVTSGILARRRQYAAGLAQLKQATTQDETPLAASVRLPFAMVSELQLEAHLPRWAYDRLRPFVTVYTSSEHINLLTAPEAVLLALPGTRPDEVHAYVGARAALTAGQSAQSLPQISGVGQFGENGELRAATVTATATAAGAVFSREAVFALSLERTRNPYTLLHWVQAPEIEPPPPPATQ
jgi:general secretion pathway protein K